MAVPVRSELFVEVESLARRVFVCWRRGQEGRRNEFRAAARALPGLGELLAIRGSGWTAPAPPCPAA